MQMSRCSHSNRDAVDINTTKWPMMFKEKEGLTDVIKDKRIDTKGQLWFQDSQIGFIVQMNIKVQCHYRQWLVG